MLRVSGLVLLGCAAMGCVSQADYDARGRELAEARDALANAGAAEGRTSTYLDKQHLESTAYQKQLNGLRRDAEALRAELELTAAQRDAQGAELAEALSDQDALAASVERMKKALAEASDRELAAQQRVHEFKRLLQRFQTLIDGGKLRVKMVDGRMVLELPTDILFGSGSASLSKDGRAALTEIGGVLSELPGRAFQVEGHTDNVPIETARFANNWELAAARALGVRATLEAAGMEPSQLSAASFGDQRPVVSNDDNAGKAMNRRIEIVLVPDLSALPGAAELEAMSENN